MNEIVSYPKPEKSQGDWEINPVFLNRVLRRSEGNSAGWFLPGIVAEDVELILLAALEVLEEWKKERHE